MWRIGVRHQSDLGAMITRSSTSTPPVVVRGARPLERPRHAGGRQRPHDTEGRTHFSMWAIFAAPLIAGNDLRSMSATTKATLTNSRGHRRRPGSAWRARSPRGTPGTNLQVWSKTLSGTNTRAVALLNRGYGQPRRSPCSGARSASRRAPRRSATSGATLTSAASPARTPHVDSEPRSRHAQGDQHALIRPWSRAPRAHLINSRTPALRAGAASRAGATMDVHRLHFPRAVLAVRGSRSRPGGPSPSLSVALQLPVQPGQIDLREIPTPGREHRRRGRWPCEQDDWNTERGDARVVAFAVRYAMSL